jgi:nucleotide-binding universal stress UspA family protein
VKPLSRILCAVDIDERSHQVFEHALALARHHGAQLLILHAVSPVIRYSTGATERVDLLRRLRSRAVAAGVNVRVEVQQGPADEIILLHATGRNVDRIVIGTSRTGSRRGFSGWIAERVLRDASCPTLVIPEHAADPAAYTESILCAVDFSPASSAVVEEAARLVEPGNRLTLLHVTSGRDAGVAARLQSLVPAPTHALVSAKVVGGRAAAEIVRTARAMDAQLLVIGAGSRSALGSRLFGTTAQLLRDARCPVLAVPPTAIAKVRTDYLPPLAA